MSTNLIIAIVLFAVLILVLWFFSRKALGSDSDRLDTLKQGAEHGDVYSQFKLGQFYYEGKDIGRDYGEAAKWFTLAARQDHAEAQYILASLYEKGNGVKQSYEEAFRWYLQAATQGHERASVILESNKWTVFKKRHLAGDETQPPRIPQEGPDHDLEHQDVHQDREKPDAPAETGEQLRKYLVKAQEGDVDAQYNLGIMYYHGEGAAKDYGEALKWFHLAADQNDADAQCNLGFMYGRGEGTKKDHRQSIPGSPGRKGNP